MNEASVHLFLDTRKIKANRKYPVKLTVYHQEDKKRYSTGIDLSEEEWQKLNSEKLRDQGLKDLRFKLQGITTKATTVIKGLDKFTFPEFEKGFLTQKKDRELIFPLFQDYIDTLKSNGQIGTAITYNTTLNSLQEINTRLKIKDITPEFLKKYEKWHLDKGNSNTTIGINMRNIRCILNVAIQKGYLKPEEYPFRKYTIPGGQNIKKALREEDLTKLTAYRPNNKYQSRAHDLWLFSYLCNGMNMADIARLKWQDIDGEYLCFYRAKTIRTKVKDSRPIKVPIHPRAMEILDKQYLPKQKDENPYIFGILEPGLTPVTEKYRIQRLIKYVNRYMKEIAADLGIVLNNQRSLTTYVARHTYSTV